MRHRIAVCEKDGRTHGVTLVIGTSAERKLFDCVDARGSKRQY